MQQPARVVRNTFFQILSRGVVVLVSLLVTAILTRVLGADSFGDYVFITSIVLLFVGLSDFGTATIAVRDASAKPEQKQTVFEYVFGLKIIVSFFVFFVFNLLVLVLPQFTDLRTPSFIASLVILFLVLRTSTQAILQVFLRMDLFSLLEIIASVLILLMIGLFFVSNKTIDLNWLMVFWVISALFSGLIGIYFSRKYLRPKIRFSRVEFVKLLKQASPLGVYLMIYAMYDRGIDSFFLKTFVDSKAVGLYGLSYKIHGNLIFGAAFLMNSLFPIISYLGKEKEKLKIIFEKAYTVLFLTGLLVLIFGTILSPLVIKVIAGQNYLVSINILRILLFATFFSFLNHLNGYLMISLNEQKKLLYFSLFSLTLNFGLNIIFIPKFSYWAAAIITILTEGTIFFLTKSFLKKKYQLNGSWFVLKTNFTLLLKNKQNYFNF